MNNKELKNLLLTLCESIDLGLTDLNDLQAYDLDLVVTPETEAYEFAEWFMDVTGSAERREKAIFVMSDETYQIVRRLHDDDMNYLWDSALGSHCTILDRPYIIKAKIQEAQNES